MVHESSLSSLGDWCRKMAWAREFWINTSLSNSAKKHEKKKKKGERESESERTTGK